MPRKSGELQLQATRLGLPTHGTREDLMIRIREFLVERDKLFTTSQFEPMLAHNAKDFLDYDLPRPWLSKQLLQLWTHEDILVEPKLDGIRVKAHFSPLFPTNPRLDSRRRSDVNFVFAEKTENFDYMRFDLGSLPEQCHDMILDGEFLPPEGCLRMWNPIQNMWVDNLQIATSIWNSGPDMSRMMQEKCQAEYKATPVGNECPENAKFLAQGVRLHYHIFDIVKFNGQWCYHLPLKDRHPLKVWAASELMARNSHYHLVPSWTSEVNRIELFERELANGGEGVMFKNVNYPYEMGRRVQHQLKLKRFQTIDAVITGFVPASSDKGWAGLVGAFEVSCRAGETWVHVASVSAMDFETRKRVSAPDGSLRKEYYGKVVEVRFQQMTTRSFRGRHAVMVRWRDDKNAQDCGIEQIQEAPSEMMTEG